MRRLFLIRHAKTETSDGMPDIERRLEPRGRSDASRLAEWFRKHRQTADLIVQSNAVRARETADIFAVQWLPDRPRLELPELYGAPWREIVKVIRALPDTAHTVALVGHNPGIHDAARLLTGSGDVSARARLGEKMPTCACAGLDFAVEHWKKLETGKGALTLFMTPEGF
jgi:phosphohistidine phosphatase